MTLRLRLGLVFTGLVAVVLVASGAGLHLLLHASLRRDLDGSLQQAAGILTTLVENDENGPRLTQPGEPSPRLPQDLVAVLVAPSGTIFDALGSPPAGVAPGTPGLRTVGDWRVLAVPVSGVLLELMRSTAGISTDLRRFDRSFLLLLPVALLVAFGLALTLSGQALRPIDRLTRRALALAERHEWREELPEPRRRDEVWRLARATNVLLGALRGVIEAERTFTSNAAHELRTPLTVLRGRIEQAWERSTDAGARVALEKAMAANDRLLGLVQTLLLLARTDAGEGVEATPVDLRAAVGLVAGEARTALKPHHREIDVDLPPTPVIVRGNLESLCVALRNVVDNAGKFGGRGAVRIALAADDAGACVTIDDDGPGIPDADLERIFQRFHQADSRHRRHGSGLGLAIARQIVAAHGGTVHAENRPEGGARIVLSLPRGPDAEHA